MGGVVSILVVAVLLLVGRRCGWFGLRPAARRTTTRLRVVGGRVRDRVLRRVPPAESRPLEEIARHARRLRHEYHRPPAGRSFAKLDGVRRAYDDVLAEACAAVGVDTLIGVLPAGIELDDERTRIERRLIASGFDLDPTDWWWQAS